MEHKLIVAAVPALFTGWRLSAACKCYLHIDHPRWVVVSTQLMVFMLVVAIT